MGAPIVPRTSGSSDAIQTELKASAAPSAKRKKQTKGDVCFQENGFTSKTVFKDWDRI